MAAAEGSRILRLRSPARARTFRSSLSLPPRAKALAFRCNRAPVVAGRRNSSHQDRDNRKVADCLSNSDARLVGVDDAAGTLAASVVLRGYNGLQLPGNAFAFLPDRA